MTWSTALISAIFLCTAVLILVLLRFTWKFIRTRRKRVEHLLKELSAADRSKSTRMWQLKAQRIFGLSLVFGICLSIIALALRLAFFIDERLFTFDSHTVLGNIFEHFLTHFDIAGILIGIVGIIIGCLIFYVVEESSEQNHERVNEQLLRMDKSLSQVESKLFALELVTSLEQRLNKIAEIITHARRNPRNHYYSMSYTANYGQFLMYNIAVLQEELGISAETLLKQPPRLLFEKLKEFKDMRERNLKLLDECASEFGEERFHMAILKTSRSKTSTSGKLERFLNTRVMNGKAIAFLNRQGNKKMEDFVTKPLSRYYISPAIDKTYVDDSPGAIDKFVEDRLKVDHELLSALDTVKVSDLDYVPFQFFVSVSAEADSKNCLGLLVFTDYNYLGETSSVMSFSTANPDLCQGLANMHYRLLKAQDKKEDRQTIFRQLFSATTDTQIRFILRKISYDEKEESQKTAVISVSDNMAMSELTKVLNKNDIGFVRIVEYAEQKDVAQILNSSKGHEIIFSIGIFHNPVTEYLFCQGENDRLFNLINKVIDANGVLISPSSIAVVFHDRKSGKNLYRYLSSDGITPNSDFVLISQHSTNGKKVWVCGGLREYGTERLASCFQESNCKYIVDQRGESQSFLIIYRVTDQSIDLVHFSIINKDGIPHIVDSKPGLFREAVS